VDNSAYSVVVVPLRMVEDVFGAMVVVAKQPYALEKQECDLLLRYARHIVPPIQRVRLQTQATTDVLTGLANRREFRGRLADEVERAHRYKTPLSLLMLDIDHFKRVNDTFGHPAGDAILNQIGVILSQVPRATDFAARYGGEEMAVICPQTGTEAAAILAERIRARVEGTLFALPDGESLRVTVSVGVATLPDHAHDADALLARADDALYDAKEVGRNRVHTAVGGGRSHTPPPSSQAVVGQAKPPVQSVGR
jgi:diguanylate cyclase (GGDEF)-like protein